MSELEASTMPNPNYMEFQTEIEWCVTRSASFDAAGACGQR